MFELRKSFAIVTGAGMGCWTFTKEELIEAREESGFSDDQEFIHWLHDGYQDYTNDQMKYTVRRD